MAFAKDILDLRFAQNVVLLDYGGLPPRPPADEPERGDGEGRPERPEPFRIRWSTLACAALASASFTATVFMMAANRRLDVETVQAVFKPRPCELFTLTPVPAAEERPWQCRLAYEFRC